MIGSVGLGTLASSLATQSRVAATAAANIANVDTPGYQAQRGQPVSLTPSGVGYAALPAQGQVDLGQQMVDLSVASHAYAASAKAYAAISSTEDKALAILA